MRPFKLLVARFLLWFLGRGLTACGALDSRVQAEVRHWPEGVSVAMCVAPAGPAMVVGRRGGRLRLLGSGRTDTADLLITFKHVDAALPVLLGQTSIARSYAERRMTMKGDLTFAMSVVRVMLIVEACLFPRLITRRIMQRIPAREVSMARIYLAALFGA